MNKHADFSKGEQQCSALSTLLSGANCCARLAGHGGVHENVFGTEFTACVWKADRLPQKYGFRCPEHKRYKARRAPRRPCEHCWRIYIRKNPG